MPRIAEVALFTEDVSRLIVGPRDFYCGRSAYLRDPDGSAVELQPES